MSQNVLCNIVGMSCQFFNESKYKGAIQSKRFLIELEIKPASCGPSHESKCVLFCLYRLQNFFSALSLLYDTVSLLYRDCTF